MFSEPLWLPRHELLDMIEGRAKTPHSLPVAGSRHESLGTAETASLQPRDALDYCASPLNVSTAVDLEKAGLELRGQSLLS